MDDPPVVLIVSNEINSAELMRRLEESIEVVIVDSLPTYEADFSALEERVMNMMLLGHGMSNLDWDIPWSYNKIHILRGYSIKTLLRVPTSGWPRRPRMKWV